MDTLDSRSPKNFYNSLNNYIPIKYFTNDPHYRKIMFYSYVYFAAVSWLTKDKQYDVRIKEMKAFLDSNGKHYANDNEYIHLFALPYVPSPYSHQLYKQYFDQEFLDSFRSMVGNFLVKSLPHKSQNPTLVKMAQAWILFHKNKKDADAKQKMLNLLEQREELLDENTQLRDELSQSNQREDWLKKKVKEDYNKWSNISKELLDIGVNILNRVSMYENNNYLNDKYMIDMSERLKRYNYFIDLMLEENSFVSEQGNANLNTTDQYRMYNQGSFVQSEQHPLSLSGQQLSISHNPHTMANNPNLPNLPNHQDSEEHNVTAKKFIDIKKDYAAHLVPLDYSAIKQIVMKGREKSSVLCSILQAISWRLEYTSRTSSKEQILDIHDNDLLDIQSEQEYEPIASHGNYKVPRIINQLLFNYGLKVRQYTIRLVNTIASDSIGRSYLLANSFIIYILNDILKEENNETLLRQDALGALQKFSLRRNPQDIMIELNLIRYLISILLRELLSMSDYSLEYSTALLMNLSLRTKGKDKCEKENPKILELLFQMVDHKNEQVRTYVNGILYSVLSRKSIRSKASEMHLKDILESLMDHSEERFEIQYKYIINQLNSDKQDISDNKSEIDDDDSDNLNEDEEIDEDINIEDEDFGQFGIDVGEDILQKFYTDRKLKQYEQNLSHKPSNSSAIKRDEKELFRPITPSLKNSFNQRKQTPVYNKSVDKDYDKTYTNGNNHSNINGNSELRRENDVNTHFTKESSFERATATELKSNYAQPFENDERIPLDSSEQKHREDRDTEYEQSYKDNSISRLELNLNRSINDNGPHQDSIVREEEYSNAEGNEEDEDFEGGDEGDEYQGTKTIVQRNYDSDNRNKGGLSLKKSNNSNSKSPVKNIDTSFQNKSFQELDKDQKEFLSHEDRPIKVSSVSPQKVEQEKEVVFPEGFIKADKIPRTP